MPLLDKVSVDEAGGLAEALGDVVIVDDLQTVPEDFAGLAVTRDGSYYRPREGQLGLAAGVPAALLLDRRAVHDRLRSESDVVQSQELREKAVAAAQARCCRPSRSEAGARRCPGAGGARRGGGGAS